MRKLFLTDDELALLSQLASVGVSDVARRIQGLQDKIKRASGETQDRGDRRGGKIRPRPAPGGKINAV